MTLQDESSHQRETKRDTCKHVPHFGGQMLGEFSPRRPRDQGASGSMHVRDQRASSSSPHTMVLKNHSASPLAQVHSAFPIPENHSAYQIQRLIRHRLIRPSKPKDIRHNTTTGPNMYNHIRPPLHSAKLKVLLPLRATTGPGDRRTNSQYRSTPPTPCRSKPTPDQPLLSTITPNQSLSTSSPCTTE